MREFYNFFFRITASVSKTTLEHCRDFKIVEPAEDAFLRNAQHPRQNGEIERGI